MAVCQAYGETALLQCLEQEGEQLPALDAPLAPEQQQRVLGCALGTVALVGYLDHGERDASCQVIALMQSPQ